MDSWLRHDAAPVSTNGDTVDSSLSTYAEAPSKGLPNRKCSASELKLVAAENYCYISGTKELTTNGTKNLRRGGHSLHCRRNPSFTKQNFGPLRYCTQGRQQARTKRKPADDKQTSVLDSQ